MTMSLPLAIASYFAADAADNPDAFMRLFADHAVVIDERRTYSGRDAIRAWKWEAAAKYNYTAEPVALVERGSQTVVTAHLTGDFPGSPIDLNYAFTLDAGSITRLEIAP